MRIVCPECGTEFEGTRKDMACSPECRKKRDTRRARERQARVCREQKQEQLAAHENERHCPDCGKLITDYRCPACWAKRGRPADGGFEEHTAWIPE